MQHLARESYSGYDLKRRFDSTSLISLVWHAYDTQIYRELKALEQAGLVRSTSEQGRAGPRRRVYSLTASGRSALVEWLQSPVELLKTKDEFIMRMWTADLIPTESLTSMLHEFRNELVKRIENSSANYEKLRAAHGPPELTSEPDKFARQLVIEHQMAVYRARLAWVERALTVVAFRAAAEKSGVSLDAVREEHVD